MNQTATKRHDPKSSGVEGEGKALFGLTRARRFRLYGWSAVLAVLAAAVGTLVYLQPHRWYTYTDVVSFEQKARDAKVGYVLWEPATPLADELAGDGVIVQPSFSSDGARMVYAAPGKEGTLDLFLRRWDGQSWSTPRPLRALNSNFEETAPGLSGDGRFLYFASDRPGGRGGMDIWVARWDGVEYAWPLPLTGQVNTPFDETDPAPSSDQMTLYFASNQPRERIDGDGSDLDAEAIEKLKSDFDLYAADLASHDLPYDLEVERQLSMLYSLRDSALGDSKVMAKLGGTPETEGAVSRALAYLRSKQSEDGHWDLKADGGAPNHDMGATAFALLAFYGRGYTHDRPSEYQEAVRKGMEWLTQEQDKATGDLRGKTIRGDMYDHGIASLAVIEAYGLTKDPALRPRAQSAIEFIEQSQHEAGGWRYSPGQAGDLSVSGWIIMALASADMSGLRVDKQTIHRAREFLRYVSGGKHGGAFGYDRPPRASGHTAAMNAVGFFCSQLLGVSSSSMLSREAAGLTAKLGLQADDLYYSYYGTVASYQYQGPLWRDWLAAMREKLTAAQREDGAWVASGPHGSRMGTIVSTALATLSLEAHYRYTPLYGLGYEPDPEASPALSDQLIPLDEIPDTPLYRHAAHLAELSSPGNDTGPVVTEHGDFLYFASDRPGGFGDSDLYRARFRRRIGSDEKEHLVPVDPTNLGPEINTAAAETAPALRMEGFHLVFDSSQPDGKPSLHGAMSKRVIRKYDFTKTPGLAWARANLGLLMLFLAGFVALVISTRIALRMSAHTGEPSRG